MQVGGGVADGQPVPVDEAGYAEVVVAREHECARVDAAEHDDGLELPERIGVDRGHPARPEGARQVPARGGAIDETTGLVAHLIARAHRQALGTHDGDRERVHGSERGAQRRRHAATVRDLRGVDVPAVDQVGDQRGGAVDDGLTDGDGSGEREHRAHAIGQCGEGACLGAQLLGGVYGGGDPHGEASAVVEYDDGRVESSGRAIGERAGGDDAGTRNGGGDARG